jgi:hypothetical protein
LEGRRAGNRRNMPAFFQRVPPPSDDDGDELALTPELHDYIAACVRAARPSDLRMRALVALGVAAADDVSVWIDWDGLEREAARQGCTVADIVFDRAGRRPDPR